MLKRRRSCGTQEIVIRCLYLFRIGIYGFLDYGLSKTATAVNALPSASVPFVAEVIIFPSFETTVRTVLWYFPPCFERSSVTVSALTGLRAVVSHGKPVPVRETALPSYLASVTLSIFDPSALSPLAVILTPPGVDSRVTWYVLRATFHEGQTCCVAAFGKRSAINDSCVSGAIRDHSPHPL